MMKDYMTPAKKRKKKGGIDYANLRHTYENIVRANLSASLTLVCTPSSRRDTKIRAHFTKSLTSPSIHPSIYSCGTTKEVLVAERPKDPMRRRNNVLGKG